MKNVSQALEYILIFFSEGRLAKVEGNGGFVPESTMVSSVLSLPPLLRMSDMKLEYARSKLLRIVCVIVSIVSALSGGNLLDLFEIVLETHVERRVMECLS